MRQSGPRRFHLAKQMAGLGGDVHKVRLLSKDETFKAQKKAFLSKHAVLQPLQTVLQAPLLEWKKKEALIQKSKAGTPCWM
jgi:hypothetical protein